MPLDAIGFENNDFGSSGYQAMLVIPDYMAEHIEHTQIACPQGFNYSHASDFCPIGAWIEAAIDATTNRHNLTVDKVYVTSPAEITPSHLKRYHDRIVLLATLDGLDNQVASLARYIPKAPVVVHNGQRISMHLTDTTHENGHVVGYIHVPDTVERLIEQQQEFGIVMITPFDYVIAAETDASQSKTGVNGQIVLRPAFMGMDIANTKSTPS
jgi:hypothetical protein